MATHSGCRAGCPWMLCSHEGTNTRMHEHRAHSRMCSYRWLAKTATRKHIAIGSACFPHSLLNVDGPVDPALGRSVRQPSPRPRSHDRRQTLHPPQPSDLRSQDPRGQPPAVFVGYAPHLPTPQYRQPSSASKLIQTMPILANLTDHRRWNSPVAVQTHSVVVALARSPVTLCNSATPSLANAMLPAHRVWVRRSVHPLLWIRGMRWATPHRRGKRAPLDPGPCPLALPLGDHRPRTNPMTHSENKGMSQVPRRPPVRMWTQPGLSVPHQLIRVLTWSSDLYSGRAPKAPTLCLRAFHGVLKRTNPKASSRSICSMFVASPARATSRPRDTKASRPTTRRTPCGTRTCPLSGKGGPLTPHLKHGGHLAESWGQPRMTQLMRSFLRALLRGQAAIPPDLWRVLNPDVPAPRSHRSRHVSRTPLSEQPEARPMDAIRSRRAIALNHVANNLRRPAPRSMQAGRPDPLGECHRDGWQRLFPAVAIESPGMPSDGPESIQRRAQFGPVVVQQSHMAPKPQHHPLEGQDASEGLAPPGVATHPADHLAKLRWGRSPTASPTRAAPARCSVAFAGARRLDLRPLSSITSGNASWAPSRGGLACAAGNAFTRTFAGQATLGEHEAAKAAIRNDTRSNKSYTRRA